MILRGEHARIVQGGGTDINIRTVQIAKGQGGSAGWTKASFGSVGGVVKLWSLVCERHHFSRKFAPGDESRTGRHAALGAMTGGGVIGGAANLVAYPSTLATAFGGMVITPWRFFRPLLDTVGDCLQILLTFLFLELLHEANQHL